MAGRRQTRSRLVSAALLAGLAAVAAPAPGLAQDEFDDELEDELDGPADGYAPFDDDGFLEDDTYRGSGAEGTGERGAATGGEPADERAWRRRFRTQSTWDGPIGGLRVADADVGPMDSLRVQLLTGFFVTSDFLVPGDEHEHVGGVFSASFTALPFLELFASLSSYSNANAWERPGLFQTVGDPLVGAKVSVEASPILRVGGELDLMLTTGTSAGLDPSSMGGRLRGLASVDLRGLDEPVPFIARGSLAYALDNSAALVERVETLRYRALPDPRPRADEARHLVTPIERFGLGMSRVDFVELGLGLEAPLRAAEELYVRPLLEYTVGIPVNRRGFDCLHVPAAERALGDDGCLDRVGAAAVPMRLTLGARVLPPVRGLSALVAVDIGLTGTSWEHGVSELPATPPWSVVLGLGYAFDARPFPEPAVVRREVERTVEVRDEAPPRGRVRGRVVSTNGGAVVPRPLVRYEGREATAQLGDDQGAFASFRFEPGAVRMRISAADHEEGGCDATLLDDGGDVEVLCELVHAPPLVVVEETEVTILEQIHFAFDSHEILEASFALMEAIARTLRDNTQLARIEIQGHTDDQGSAAYNQSLSDRRAASVRRWLVEHGVEEGRLTSNGYGLTRPVVPNDTDENRARNRRVQFIILDRTDR